MPEPLVETDFNWHDGVLVDLQFVNFGGERPGIQLTVDLYPDTDPHTERRRYRSVGAGLTRFVMNGDMTKFAKAANSGNIDWMRMDFTDTTEVVVLLMFGGYLELEATTFTLTELNS
jgi:hypothetical protein